MLENYFKIFDIALYACLGIFVLAYMPKLIYYAKGIFFNQRKDYLKPAKENHKFAVIIPARNESFVIRNLLEALKNQTYDKDKFDIYVAVESLDDPTVKICSEYERTEVFLKKDLSRIGKSYVMEEVTDYISKEKQDENYEAYIVLDADNIPCKIFIEELNKAYDLGYDFGVGNRNTKNWNDGWIAACTGLTFIKLSRFQNFGRSRTGRGALITGTGYFVKKALVDSIGGWQWFSLTEDFEMTNWTAINNWKACYCNKALFYDEQPTDFRTSFKQRKRWIKGFFWTASKYRKQITKGIFSKKSKRLACLELKIGVLPLITLAVGFIVYSLAMITGSVLFSFTDMQKCYESLIRLGSCLGLFYVLLVIDSTIMLMVEHKNIDIKFLNRLTAILMHPFYSALYVVIAIYSFFVSVEWEPIQHKVNIDIEETNINIEELNFMVEEVNKKYENA